IGAASSKPGISHLFSFLILGVVIEQLRRSKLPRALHGVLVLFFAPLVQHCSVLRGERLVAAAVAGDQINSELAAKPDDVAPCMPIALGILGGQLLHARFRLSHGPLPFALLELDRLAERTLKQWLEVVHNGSRLPLGALRIAALSRLELMFPRRTARADLVLL